ncbi:MAG: hypothetical protein FWB80_12940 [Defluviitaleaceae bacterium]|nr:hypothetical protein [Defluviitaleaceae bacterium]
MLTGIVVMRIIFLLVLLLVIPVTIFLQAYLSKRESKWYGLILPFITLMLSVIVSLNMITFTQTNLSHLQYIDGEWVNVLVSESEWEFIPGAVGAAIFSLILLNIPTGILLIIYKIVRSNQNQRREMEKMSVQDL